MIRLILTPEEINYILLKTRPNLIGDNKVTKCKILPIPKTNIDQSIEITLTNKVIYINLTEFMSLCKEVIALNGFILETLADTAVKTKTTSPLGKVKEQRGKSETRAVFKAVKFMLTTKELDNWEDEI